MQGPAELLPVSSSAHISLLPWFAGWPWHELDAEARKSFEVALHAGAAAALVAGQRRLIARELRQFDRRRAAVVGLSFVPPAVAGLLGERWIERRLGGPGATAAGLVAGSAALALADRGPQLRGHGEAGALDGLVLGLAQATALVPGVSRNGATLAAARLRRFTRAQSDLLSRTVALPVIVGAAVLKGVRLRRRGIDGGLRTALAAGTVASFASTLVAQRALLPPPRRRTGSSRPLWPFAVYRLALAAAVVGRMRR